MRTFNTYSLKFWASLVAQLVKNPFAMQESTCNAGEQGSIPGSKRSPGEGNGNPLQYSCLENPMDREAWWATVHGVARVGHNLATKPPPPHVKKRASQVVLVIKNPPTNAGDIRDLGSIPGMGRSPGEGDGNPLQFSCLRNPMDRGACWATVHGVAELDMTEWLTLSLWLGDVEV